MVVLVLPAGQHARDQMEINSGLSSTSTKESNWKRNNTQFINGGGPQVHARADRDGVETEVKQIHWRIQGARCRPNSFFFDIDLCFHREALVLVTPAHAHGKS